MLSVDKLRNGPPKLITFLPGFWLLVPGAAGLIGVTELLGVRPELGAQALVDMLITVMSIALGVLMGTAAYNGGGLRAALALEVALARRVAHPPPEGW